MSGGVGGYLEDAFLDLFVGDCPVGVEQEFFFHGYPRDSSSLSDLNLSKIGARINLKARDFRRCFSRLNDRMS
jgi:hypothetical protein